MNSALLNPMAISEYVINTSEEREKQTNKQTGIQADKYK